MPEDWRRPIRARFEVRGGVPIIDRDGRQHEPLVALMPEKDMRRIRRGLACPECLSVFPCPPSGRNLHIFEADCQPFAAPLETARRRIKEGKCPHCGVEVRDEVVAALEVKGKVEVPGDWLLDADQTEAEEAMRRRHVS